jgi:hypothetical protein
MFDKTILHMRNRTVTTKLLRNGDVLFWGRFVLGTFCSGIVLSSNSPQCCYNHRDNSYFFLVYIEGPYGLILRNSIFMFHEEMEGIHAIIGTQRDLF